MRYQATFLFSGIFALLLTVSCHAARPDYSKMSEAERYKIARKTEQWEPVPKQLSFNKQGIPSDAIVLFDGTNLDAFSGKKGAAEWIVADGIVTVKPGSGGITTKEAFCDMQLHVEWRSPAKPSSDRKGQKWGNSGFYFMGRYEVQVLNSYENPTYANGQAASIYKQFPPLVNASTPPMTWQNYDIIFTAPKFNDKGGLISPAAISVLHNGVLVQNHSVLKGPTVYIGEPEYSAHGCAPLFIQDHRDPVSYRNMWVRKL